MVAKFFPGKSTDPWYDEAIQGDHFLSPPLPDSSVSAPPEFQKRSVHFAPKLGIIFSNGSTVADSKLTARTFQIETSGSDLNELKLGRGSMRSAGPVAYDGSWSESLGNSKILTHWDSSLKGAENSPQNVSNVAYGDPGGRPEVEFSPSPNCPLFSEQWSCTPEPGADTVDLDAIISAAIETQFIESVRDLVADCP
jgi:hypothetical protein